MQTICRTVTAAIAAAAVAVAVAAPAASADPGRRDYRILAGVGSASTQQVMSALGDVIRDEDGEKVLASWDAGRGTVKTKVIGCEIDRPQVTVQGQRALWSAIRATPTVGCVDFVRSSTSETLVLNGSGTKIPFGIDGMTFVVHQDSDLPRNLTQVQLERAYLCLDRKIAGERVTPVLPPRGSDLRYAWLTNMGITETEIAGGDYPCLVESDRPAESLNDGCILNGHVDYIMPYWISQYLTQQRAGQTVDGVRVNAVDQRGPALLGSVDGVEPVAGATVNREFPYRREAANIVATTQVDRPIIQSMFVGSDSAICRQAGVIRAYGFAPHPDCGSVDFEIHLPHAVPDSD